VTSAYAEQLRTGHGCYTIGRGNLNGTDVSQRFISVPYGPKGVAGLTVNARHICWTNETGDSIGRANLNGTGVNQRFITGARNPDAMAIAAGLHLLGQLGPRHDRLCPAQRHRRQPGRPQHARQASRCGREPRLGSPRNWSSARLLTSAPHQERHKRAWRMPAMYGYSCNAWPNGTGGSQHELRSMTSAEAGVAAAACRAGAGAGRYRAARGGLLHGRQGHVDDAEAQLEHELGSADHRHG
jgi:hypothetical protein